MPLHLLVPGLLEPWPDEHYPRLPALETLLARGREQTLPGDYASLLCRRFGIEQARPATASLAWQADVGSPPPAHVFHADPVHLRADRDRVMLFPFPEVQLDAQEAGLFQEAFNQHFGEQGLYLHVPRPHRWYLTLEQAEDGAPEAPLAKVAGRDLQAFMPRGRFWKQLLNEVQMLFFELGVNQQRQARGQLAVSGLWFSGGGERPVPRYQPESVKGKDLLLSALLRSDLPHRLGERLWVETGLEQSIMLGDTSSRKQSLQALDAELARHLGEAEIVLYPCTGRIWHWKPIMRYRLWKPTTALFVLDNGH